MLGRQPLRFLQADDPAADKTVMGGLLTKELLVRGSLARCPIIAPGSLVGQWQGKLLDKFDLAFEIMSRAHPVKSNGTVLVQRVTLDRFLHPVLLEDRKGGTDATSNRLGYAARGMLGRFV